MKNLKEIQAQADLLKIELEAHLERLKQMRQGLPFLFTHDAVYQAEKHVSMLNTQLGVLTWVAA